MGNRDNHPFPIPPSGDPFRELPASIPWDDPISTMPEFWIATTCQRCRSEVKLPLRLMAAQIGWDRTLRDVVPQLRCKTCKDAPASAVLVDDPSGHQGRSGRPRRRLDLMAH